MKPEENSGWDYKHDSSSGEPAEPAATPADGAAPKTIHQTSPAVNWTAPDSIQHDRSPLWYPALLLSFIGLAVIIYVITKDYFASGVTVVIGAIAAFASARKPRDISCQIAGNSITIGTKSYNFSQFKSFGIVREGKLSYVELIPVKRFMPAISSYFNEADEHNITSAIGQFLPYEERKMAGIEKLSHHFKF